MYRFRSEPDLLRLLKHRNKERGEFRDEINKQASKKSQAISHHHHHQSTNNHQQKELLLSSDSQTQDEKLRRGFGRRTDGSIDNQQDTFKTRIRNGRLSLSDLSLTRQIQPVSSSSNQQRLNNLRLVGLLTRLRPNLTRRNTSNSTQAIGSEPELSNQVMGSDLICHTSDSRLTSILSSQPRTAVNDQSDLQPSSLPVSLRLPLSPTTRPRPTPKPKSSNPNPTAIRPHTPDLTTSRPQSPSQINLASLGEVRGGVPSELSYRLPDPPSPISAFEINLSTQSNDSHHSLNRTLNLDQRCPMVHQSKDRVRSGLSGHQASGQTLGPLPLPHLDLPQRTLTLPALPQSERPESARSSDSRRSQQEHVQNHQSSSKLEIERKEEDSEVDEEDVLGDEELYSAQTHLSPKNEILPISGPSREALPIIVQDSNWDDLGAEPVKLQSSQKNSHRLRAFTISVLKNERNLTVSSSRSSSSSSSSSISEAFHPSIPRSSTPVSNMFTNGISLIKSRSLKSNTRPLKQSVNSPVFLSTRSFNNSLDPLQNSQSNSSDIIRPGTSHASEQNHTEAVTILSGSKLVQSPENSYNQHLDESPRKRATSLGILQRSVSDSINSISTGNSKRSETMDARKELKMLMRSQTIRNESDHSSLFRNSQLVPSVSHKAVVKKRSTAWRTISTSVGSPRESETANVLIKKKSTNILSGKFILTGEKTEVKAPKKKGKEVGLKLIERIKSKQTGQEEDEVSYLERLASKVENSRIASLLATSSEPFHLSALKEYMNSFEFSHDPIDLSLRKLLMGVYLPKESQQIDRLMEVFSNRYMTCNPRLFQSADAFNKNNRAKMTRIDYVKNTKIDGIPSEVLEYIYDNVTFTEFIFVDEDKDGEKSKRKESRTYPGSSAALSAEPATNANLKALISASKIDPYQLIADGLTHELRPDIESLIPSRNPFSFTGTVPYFDFKKLRKSFGANAATIQVISLTPLKSHSVLKNLTEEVMVDEQDDHHQKPQGTSSDPTRSRKSSTGHSPNPQPGSKTPLHYTEMERIGSEDTTEVIEALNQRKIVSIRAIKVGLVYRKDESNNLSGFFENNNNDTPFSPPKSMSKKTVVNTSKSKWRGCCVILTVGQILFMKDVSLVDELKGSIEQAQQKNSNNRKDQLVVRITGLKPDSIYNLTESIALLDSTYHSRPSTFRLILANEQNFLLAVDEENEMNSWITHINYAATFKTCRLGIKIPIGHESYQPVFPSSINTNFENHSSSQLRDSQNSKSNPSIVGNRTPNRFDTGEEFARQLRLPLSRQPSLGRVNTPNGSNWHSRAGSPDSTEGLNHKTTLNRSSSMCNFISKFQPHNNFDWANRLELIKTKIVQVESSVIRCKMTLNEDLRLARNLAVLTPFQISTRNRLQNSIMPISERVKTLRMSLSRWVCYREILIREGSLLKEMEATGATMVKHASGPYQTNEARGEDDQTYEFTGPTPTVTKTLMGEKKSESNPKDLGVESADWSSRTGDSREVQEAYSNSVESQGSQIKPNLGAPSRPFSGYKQRRQSFSLEGARSSKVIDQIAGEIRRQTRRLSGASFTNTGAGQEGIDLRAGSMKETKESSNVGVGVEVGSFNRSTLQKSLIPVNVDSSRPKTIHNTHQLPYATQSSSTSNSSSQRRRSVQRLENSKWEFGGDRNSSKEELSSMAHRNDTDPRPLLQRYSASERAERETTGLGLSKWRKSVVKGSNEEVDRRGIVSGGGGLQMMCEGGSGTKIKKQKKFMSSLRSRPSTANPSDLSDHPFNSNINQSSRLSHYSKFPQSISQQHQRQQQPNFSVSSSTSSSTRSPNSLDFSRSNSENKRFSPALGLP